MHRLLITILLILILISEQGFSQVYAEKEYAPRASYGLFGDVGLNLHTADFANLPGIPSCCPRYETGFGIGYGIGLFAAFPVSDKLELTFRLGYHDLGGELSRTEDIRLAANDGSGIDGQFEHRVDSRITSVALTPLLSLRVGDQLRLHAGFRAGYLLTKELDQVEEIVDPDYGVFANEQSRTRNEFNNMEIPDYSSLEAAITAGISYDLPLNKAHTLFLVPEAFFNFGVISVSSSESWTVNTFNGGVALRWAPRRIIPPKPPAPPPPPPPLPPPPPPPLAPVLDANILAVGLNDDGSESNVSTLKVEEFLFTRMHPILNYVFFEEGSSDLPPRYKRMSQEERSGFSVKQLYDLKTMEVYYNVLNIVGRRMEFYPQARVRLVGCNSNEGTEKGNTTLSRNRAASVKNYLVDVWKIPEDRITVESRNLPDLPSNVKDPDGLVENRRVEIIANMPQVFEPMIIRDTLREANPPNIRFKSKINAEMGIQSWKIITAQNDRDLKVFQGNGEPPANIDWNTALEDEQEFMPRFDKPLNYKLQVVDNDNKIWDSPIQTLPVEQMTIEKKMFEMIEDKEIDRFSLILFGFGQHTLSKENESIAAFAKKRIRKWSTVTIRGFSDRVGDEDYNMKLSQRRANETAKELGVSQSSVQALGESLLLYDNNLPEGRFYCRTVNIEIVTPIE